jgi:hypothetical protein
LSNAATGSSAEKLEGALFGTDGVLQPTRTATMMSRVKIDRASLLCWGLLRGMGNDVIL